MTNQQAFLVITGVIFGIVALIHALRLALRWQVKVNQREIPMSLSVGRLIVENGLCSRALWLLFC
jgi:hypothetical protein